MQCDCSTVALRYNSNFSFLVDLFNAVIVFNVEFTNDARFELKTASPFTKRLKGNIVKNIKKRSN